jgi:dTDP-4-dehydrorhamnose 3,5-epimerase
VATDERGVFVKTFVLAEFLRSKLKVEFQEEYYTTSHEGVLRGLHFQSPPAQHAKLVYCVQGAVMDAIVDLRRGSESYGSKFWLELDAADPRMIYVAPGVAHGFFVRKGPATLVYKVTSAYSPTCDSGIRWDSAGIPWPVNDPVLSVRDRSFPTLQEFSSPFAI